MSLFFLLLSIFLAITSAEETCTTPNQKPGKCVLISHCPHLFYIALTNQTTNLPKNHVQQSHCGFESTWFPKVCCPNEAVRLYHKIHPSKQSSKCGLHVPGGDDDPWLTLLEFENSNGRRAILCGGVLIHKKYVLTAAHCFLGNYKLVGVHFGGNNQPIAIDDLIIHEHYDPSNRNQTHDIALVSLKKKVSFKHGDIRPICLPFSKGHTEGSLLQLAGWEKLNNETQPFNKKAGLASVRNNSECSLAYNVTLGDSQICVNGKSKAKIDFGGILMEVSGDTSYSLVGIMSKPPCCANGTNSKIYSKVSSYINWIFNNIDV